MPRPYVVTFENISVTAVQDLFQILGATGKTLRILSVSIGATDTTLPNSQMLNLRARYLPATVTNGSGGSTATPAALDPGDAAASFTAKINNTTQASTSGTAIVLGEWGVHIFSGLDYTFPRPPVIGPSESFTLELKSTVSGTVHLNGVCLVEESGG